MVDSLMRQKFKPIAFSPYIAVWSWCDCQIACFRKSYTFPDSALPNMTSARCSWMGFPELQPADRSDGVHWGLYTHVVLNLTSEIMPKGAINAHYS